MEKEGAGQIEQSNQEKENQKSLSNLKQELTFNNIYWFSTENRHIDIYHLQLSFY